MTNRLYRKNQHEYKGYIITGADQQWIIDPIGIDPNSKKFWDIRNDIPELKTLKEIKKWIDMEGIKLL
jgi:hypothetical protein